MSCFKDGTPALECGAAVSQVSDEQDHKRGRPSLPEQAKTRKRLRQFFLNSKSSEFAASKTGHDIKTVKKYYKIFAQEVLDSEEQDFIKSTKIAKKQGEYVLENQQSKLEELQRIHERQIQHSIKEGRGIPQLDSSTYKTAVKISNAISELEIKKTSLICSPTADVTLEKLTKELLKKNGISS